MSDEFLIDDRLAAALGPRGAAGITLPPNGFAGVLTGC
jgi:hypothetical protein